MDGWMDGHHRCTFREFAPTTLLGAGLFAGDGANKQQAGTSKYAAHRMLKTIKVN
jgi:hypothetical protein